MKRLFALGTLFFLCLALCGCPGPHSGPEVRFADKLTVYHVDDERPEAVKGDDQNRPGAVYIASSAQYLYSDGTGISVGGLKVDNLGSYGSYYRRGSGQWVNEYAETRSSLTTNDRGLILFVGKNAYWGANSYATGMLVRVPGKTGEQYEASASYGFDTLYDLTQSSPYPPAPWKWYQVEVINSLGYYSKITGSYWMSESYASAGSVPLSDVEAPENRLPKEPSVSAADQAFLDAATDSDMIGVDSVEWSSQAGGGGKGYLKEADTICALNHCDTESMKYSATPYYCTIRYIGPCFSGRWPVEISGGDFEPFLIGSSVTKSNGDRHLLRTDGFIAVEMDRYTLDTDTRVIDIYDHWTSSGDPNDPAVNIVADLFWEDFIDPNVVDPNDIIVSEGGTVLSNTDPNRMTSCYVLPFSEGQRPTMTLLELDDVWLSTDDDVCGISDTNNDGIVNPEDLFVN